MRDYEECGWISNSFPFSHLSLKVRKRGGEGEVVNERDKEKEGERVKERENE